MTPRAHESRRPRSTAAVLEDRSTQVITDDVFARLLTLPNVLISAHQGFFTRPALASTTVGNLDDVEAGRPGPNEVTAD